MAPVVIVAILIPQPLSLTSLLTLLTHPPFLPSSIIVMMSPLLEPNMEKPTLTPRTEADIYDNQLVGSHLLRQFEPTAVSFAEASGSPKPDTCKKHSPSSADDQEKIDCIAAGINYPHVSIREICEEDSIFQQSTKVRPPEKRYSFYQFKKH